MLTIKQIVDFVKAQKIHPDATVFVNWYDEASSCIEEDYIRAIHIDDKNRLILTTFKDADLDQISEK